LNSFLLISEFGRPIAALCHHPVTNQQLTIITSLLPEHSYNRRDLCQRWNQEFVIAPEDWAKAQLRRVPMLPPKGIQLAFL